MTTPTTVSHQALAREILQRELAVEVSNISHLGYSRSNFVYKVVLSEPTREAHHGSRKPGTVEIPKDTTRLIIRFFKPFDTFNEGVRAENIVAAMTVARSAMADSALHTIVPQVYGWSSGKEEPSGEAWVLEEYIPGTNFGDDFPTLPSHKQHAILAQFAEVVKAFQDYNFPETVKAFGGLAFNADGNVCVGSPSFQVVGGPFLSNGDFYRGLFDWQLGASDRASQNSLRPRKPSNYRLARLWSFPNFHLNYRVSSLLHSISGALTAPYSDETGGLREAILCGSHDAEDLPTSKPMRQGPAVFGSGRDIQWGLAKAWEDELAQVGALRSSTIDGADAFSRVHWLIQDLVPWHLFDPTILEIQTPEQLEEARKEVEITLGKYLDSWGF
ncbi:hypothetical protein BDV36DRAFT_298108 [Aspergillus pseudocaelatus]|uniref:Aminoglycoside phosphotransferase domain-containing protein n=1 Tax=Aspergillus pseudocaelatus TaxID=1825620 RepID=A0ABQ6WE30_9EURO|nr:hypothetical protein BDV36DRAFT_298108 [Aspergillus pseudocaelatus]